MKGENLFFQDQGDIFSKENLWSNIGIDFEKYHKDVANILLSKFGKQQQGLAAGNEQCQSMIKQLTSNFQLQLKRKLAKVLFESSVGSQEYLRVKTQNEKFQQKVMQINLSHQRKCQEMQRKIADLQTLVKIYEKALINKKIKIPQPQNQHIQPIHERQTHYQKLERKIHKLLRFHVLQMKIQPTPQDSEFFPQRTLSSSRMNSSILGRSRHQPEVLRDIEREWNNSVNISSKSIKSGHKLSVKKEEKNFMKSSMKPKQMSRSFIKENASHACKQSSSNKLFQSAVSQFNIHKY